MRCRFAAKREASSDYSETALFRTHGHRDASRQTHCQRLEDAPATATGATQHSPALPQPTCVASGEPDCRQAPCACRLFHRRTNGAARIPKKVMAELHRPNAIDAITSPPQ